MSVVFPAEGHALAIEGQQAVIAEGHTMRIPPEIVKHLSGSAECRFRVHDPILLEQRIDKSAKTLGILQFGDRSWEDEFSLLVRHAQSIDELGAEDGTEHVHGQEEVVFRVNPVFMVRGESACWNQAVDMWMQEQVLSQVCRMLMNPICAPSRSGSAAISSMVAALDRNSRSYITLGLCQQIGFHSCGKVNTTWK